MKTASNVGFAFSTSMKMFLVVLVLGAAIAVGKSPVVFGIIFLASAYFGYALIVALATGAIGFVTTLFSKNKADKQVAGNPNTTFVHPTEADLDPVARAMAAMSHLEPEQIAELVSKMAAMKAGTGPKKSS